MQIISATRHKTYVQNQKQTQTKTTNPALSIQPPHIVCFVQKAIKKDHYHVFHPHAAIAAVAMDH